MLGGKRGRDEDVFFVWSGQRSALDMHVLFQGLS